MFARLFTIIWVVVLFSLWPSLAKADCVILDIAVSDLAAPKTAAIGQPLRVTWVVTNLGPDPTDGDWYDTLYVSLDASLSADDYQLGEWWHSGVLGMGESYRLTTWVRLPYLAEASTSNLAHPGDKRPPTPIDARTVYLILVANSLGTMTEIGYVNNVAVIPIIVDDCL